jgi:hypothetical protein
MLMVPVGVCNSNIMELVLRRAKDLAMLLIGNR